MSTPTELKNFLPLSKLGQGAFSTVYKVKRVNDGQVYALKKIKMQKLKEKQQQNALNEIRILASIKSKYIISYKEAFYDHSLNLLCIVMEYANGGDLQKKITDQQKTGSKFAQKQIWKAAAQILIGLYILHEKGILHRDLKSANVFVSNDSYKLGDLNVSKVNQQKDEMARTQTGTPYYASPEVWRDQLYDNKCDIWSLGCLIYEMCCFQPPFEGADLDQLYKSVQKGRYKEIPSSYSIELTFFIKTCLKLNPKERLSAKQLFVRFKFLNEKFLQTLRNNEIKIDDNLLNTIRLPFDLRDLTKKLPSSEYKVLEKQEPRTIYNEDPQTKETVILKNRSGPQQKKYIQPLPERIKNYFKDNNNEPVKRRPERPVTSSKRKQQKDEKAPVRPISAHYINRRNNQAQVEKLRKMELKEEKNVIQKDMQHNLQKKREATYQSNQKKSALIYNPKQYRCKSSENQRRSRNILPLNSPSEKPRNKNPSQLSSQKINQNQSLDHPSLINKILQQNLELNRKLYENCKENGIKKVSSLEKKVKYIRDQRKQRKAVFDKNKENVSCISKPFNNQQSLDIKQRLKDKIKQNSQILKNKYLDNKVPVYMPVIGQRVASGISNARNHPTQKTEIIHNHLEKRKNNLISRRYVFSADSSKRVRSYTQITNEQNNSLIEKQKERRLGMICKVPVSMLPSILPNKNLPNQRINSQPYIQRKPLANIDENDIKRQELIANASMIDNSDTIIRLKKRIKSRMIFNCSQDQKTKV